MNVHQGKLLSYLNSSDVTCDITRISKAIVTDNGIKEPYQLEFISTGQLDVEFTALVFKHYNHLIEPDGTKSIETFYTIGDIGYDSDDEDNLRNSLAIEHMKYQTDDNVLQDIPVGWLSWEFYKAIILYGIICVDNNECFTLRDMKDGLLEDVPETNPPLIELSAVMKPKRHMVYMLSDGVQVWNIIFEVPDDIVNPNQEEFSTIRKWKRVATEYLDSDDAWHKYDLWEMSHGYRKER